MSPLIVSDVFTNIDLTNGAWKSINLPTNQKGIIYVLKDADTGEFLKIGKTEVVKMSGRFSKYMTASRKLGRNLSLDIFTVAKNSSSTLESLEKQMRNGLETLGHQLPWDNTNQRLGRPGPGVPSTSLPRRLRDKFKWLGEKLVSTCKK